MSAEAIPTETFLREFTRELHNKNAAVFAGAGLSMDSGYVDWKRLLENIIKDLGLDPEVEHDLVTLAQYHCNKAGGNKGRLSQTILNEFGEAKHPTANHRILAALPIHTYWTTNYDRLIEKSLEDAKKVPDIKHTLKQLAVTRPDRDVAVYKMHGDVGHPSDAVITKDDYEEYPLKMSAFAAALRGDLIEKTFLFLGFSFTDPNIDFILSRVRVQYEKHGREHYCIQKKVEQKKDESADSFKYRQLKQDYFIRDLKRFNIQTVLVEQYSDISKLLAKLAARYKQSSIFVSGSAIEYGGWTQMEAELFLNKLSYELAAAKNRVITGFGFGVGSAVINGALAYLYENGKTISDQHLMLRPFPQTAAPGKSLSEQWTAYRKSMVQHAGIAIFAFGNKIDAGGKLIVANGMKEEFDLCVEAGVRPIPIGATGYMAENLFKEVLSDFPKFHPEAKSELRSQFDKLGTKTTTDELLKTLLNVIQTIQKA